MGTSSSENSIEKLAQMIRGIKMAMLVTVSPDGSLRSRPMQMQEAEFDGTLWFFTQVDSPKVGEVQREEQVNVSYADPGSHRYVSVSGRATLVLDRRKAKELWHPLLKAWFPKGLDDPQLALLRVDAEQAEYWDVTSSTMVQLVGFLKAVVTGHRYDPAENQKVDLSSAGERLAK